jgi:hypothetical protein
MLALRKWLLMKFINCLIQFFCYKGMLLAGGFINVARIVYTLKSSFDRAILFG